MMQRLTGMLDFQAQALALRAERQRLIAGNIANADTPGYLARDFDFATALRAATAQPGTEPDALGAPVVAPLRPTALQYALAAQTNLDGNSVDMDRERASFADNAVRYEATLRFINGQVRTLLDAMKSPGQG